MSKELAELRRLARAERGRAWAHTKLIPARIGDTAGSFAKQHPLLATGGAAALTMSLMNRRRRRIGGEAKSNSMLAALAAMGVQFLPDVLRIAGLTVPTSQEPVDDGSAAGHGHCDEPLTGLADSATRGREPATQHESKHTS